MRIYLEPLHVGCMAKQRFTTFEIAERVAKRQRRGDESGKRVHAYRCKHCKGFHVGEDMSRIRERKSGRRKRVEMEFEL